MHNVLSGLSERLADESDPAARWATLTGALRNLGLDQVNYAFLDMATADRMEARGDPAMSTMRADWIEYYTDRAYDLDDPAVAHVRAGHSSPMLWSPAKADTDIVDKMNHEAVEAGLQSGLLVPLAGTAGSTLPGAAIMLGSGMPEPELRKFLSEHGMALVSAAHLFHAGAVGEMIRRRHKTPRLTPRERDCLQWLARGLRPDAIADRLTLARVTVDMHLKNARRKLGARTSAECVARALLYQMIVVE